jgi:hypothetical protein
MKIDQLKDRLHAEHHHNLQGVYTISAALAEIEHGLELLSKLGHVYHLERGAPYEIPEFPRILFHVTSAPNGRVVRSSWEAIELGFGWWPTLQEAQHKEGIRAQFRGRGGIGDRSLPMLVDGGPAGPRPDLGPEPKDNSKIIEEWKQYVRDQSAKTDYSPGGVSGISGDNRINSSERPGEIEISEGVFVEYAGVSGGVGKPGTTTGVRVRPTITGDSVPIDDVSGESVGHSE